MYIIGIKIKVMKIDDTTKTSLKYIAYGAGIFLVFKWFIKGLFKGKGKIYFWMYLVAIIIAYLSMNGYNILD